MKTPKILLIFIRSCPNSFLLSPQLLWSKKTLWRYQTHLLQLKRTHHKPISRWILVLKARRRRQIWWWRGNFRGNYKQEISANKLVKIKQILQQCRTLFLMPCHFLREYPTMVLPYSIKSFRKVNRSYLLFISHQIYSFMLKINLPLNRRSN